eukprot:1802116-Rhodomonas_salina.1
MRGCGECEVGAWGVGRRGRRQGAGERGRAKRRSLALFSFSFLLLLAPPALRLFSLFFSRLSPHALRQDGGRERRASLQWAQRPGERRRARRIQTPDDGPRSRSRSRSRRRAP